MVGSGVGVSVGVSVGEAVSVGVSVRVEIRVLVTGGAVNEGLDGLFCARAPTFEAHPLTSNPIRISKKGENRSLLNIIGPIVTNHRPFDKRFLVLFRMG
jgi:hypothetical protein